MRALLLVLAACQIDQHVKLLLGPDENTLTTGFQCPDRLAGDPLIATGFQPLARSASFVLVIDVADLGDRFPNCGAEDLALACGNNQCKLLVSVAPRRFCRKITIDNVASRADVPGAIPAALAQQASDVIALAPHRPVILRAVALPPETDCTALQTPSGGVYPTLPSGSALGCGYSCPVSLDEAPKTVSIELGLPKIVLRTPMICQNSISLCAQFPDVVTDVP